MVRISYQSVPDEFRKNYNKVLAFGDRFTHARVRRKPLFYSRRRKKGVTLRSTLPEATQEWNNLDQVTKDLWKQAGAKNDMTGFRLFWRDLAARRRNNLTGVSPPTQLYQIYVGRIKIVDPGNYIKIAQYHPFVYYVSKKVRGTRNQRKAVKVTEDFALPLKIEVSYKTNLVSAGLNPRARMYAVVTSHYQGQDIETELNVEFGLQDDWQRKSATLTKVLGMPKQYTVYFELQDVQGDLFFDLLNFEHSGQNWARDFKCNDINAGFTKVFFQVPRHWVLVGSAPHAQFESFYYNLLL